MNILGICNTTDSGAALIVDNKVVAAANEERFTRKKLDRSFPRESINYVLGSQGLRVEDIDWVGCGAWNGVDDKTTLPRLIEDIFYQIDHEQDETRKQLLQRFNITVSRDDVFRQELFSNLIEMGFPEERVICCDHHYSHALTAYYCSPFEEAMVFTADARGDFRSVTLWSASRNNGLQMIDFATELTSPGALYGFVTKYLGFIPDRHEGKVTGLAARGKPSKAYDILKAGFFYDNESGRLRSLIGSHYRPFVSATPPSLSQLDQFSREDVAHAVQALLEEALISFLMRHLNAYQEKSVDLCLAGGCMSNVKLNLALSHLKPIRNIYVFPQMGDGGSALGGALNVAVNKGKITYFQMPTVYLGPDYSETAIESALTKHGLAFKKVTPHDKVRTVSELIAQGKIVGWFQGRMEYGPRALGARSILVEAADSAITDVLNARLKRSEFMPFAPVTIQAYASQCFVGWRPDQPAARFMTTCYPCTPLLRKKCPAIVHVDGTARPQVIFREDNPEYHDVIAAYIQRTGNPAIINTSFNHHEEPIVNSPTDAIASLRKGNVDVLAMGNYLVETTREASPHHR
jgi:carbamoyltransferase